LEKFGLGKKKVESGDVFKITSNLPATQYLIYWSNQLRGNSNP
jgi:hypothetical protein